MSGTRRVCFRNRWTREVLDPDASSGLSTGAVARELGLHETVVQASRPKE